MLLQALHKYAEQHKLLERLPFQMRTVHLLLPLKADGSPRGNGFVLQTTPVTVGEKTKEKPGREYLLPRFPGENNGGKAYYLAESFPCVLGVRKDDGATLPLEDAGKDRNPVRAFRHFWQRIEEECHATNDVRLKALSTFRRRHLLELEKAIQLFEWLRWQPNESSRDSKEEWHGRLETGEWRPISKLTTLMFEIDGVPLAVPMTRWSEDTLWRHWAETYEAESFSADESEANDEIQPTICLVTGQSGLPVARSHKPKILGVPGLTSGGYVVSFAKEAPAFSSFGFEMGDNAPISEEAAASYALALNELLEQDETHFRVGEVAFCFWAQNHAQLATANARLLAQANPVRVKGFLKAPFAGVERSATRLDRFHSVLLSANAGRVVVRDWLQVPLDEAIEHFKDWFEGLKIASLSENDDDDSDRGGPCSLFRIAVTLVRESGELDRISDAIGYLYRAAISGDAPPLRLLEPLLAEFHSALVNDKPTKRTYPFGQSRFALLKLILLRHSKGGFMPTVHLCETDDEAYNLGRLLCVLAALQDAAHDYELEGPGIVERFYGSASTAPANVFGILWKLHIHHLRKLEQSESGRKIAFHTRERLASVVALFPPQGPNLPPRFPKTLSLEEQGRFALGFYQQMAADRQAIREAKAKKQSESTISNQE